MTSTQGAAFVSRSTPPGYSHPDPERWVVVLFYPSLQGALVEPFPEHRISGTDFEMGTGVTVVRRSALPQPDDPASPLGDWYLPRDPDEDDVVYDAQAYTRQDLVERWADAQAVAARRNS